MSFSIFYGMITNFHVQTQRISVFHLYQLHLYQLCMSNKNSLIRNLEDSLNFDQNFDQKNQHQLEIGYIEVTISMIAHQNFDQKTKAIRDSKPEFRPEYIDMKPTSERTPHKTDHLGVEDPSD